MDFTYLYTIAPIIVGINENRPKIPNNHPLVKFLSGRLAVMPKYGNGNSCKLLSYRIISLTLPNTEYFFVI